MIQSEEFANLTNYPIMQPPFTTVPTAANPNYPIMQPPFVTVPTAANPTMTMQAPIRPDLTLPPMMTSRQQRIMEDPFSPSIFPTQRNNQPNSSTAINANNGNQNRQSTSWIDMMDEEDVNNRERRPESMPVANPIDEPSRRGREFTNEQAIHQSNYALSRGDDAIEKLSRAIESLAYSRPREDTVRSGALRVPEITIQAFGGDILKYRPFKLSFNSYVNRCRMMDATERHLLLTHCRTDNGSVHRYFGFNFD